MTSWRKLRELSWADRRLLLRAGAKLVYLRVFLPRIGFRTQPLMADDVNAPGSGSTALTRAKVVCRMVDIAAAQGPVTVACLHKSLALWWLLRREGIPCDLRLGAGTSPGPFEAHAWVECAGVVINDGPENLARYQPFGQPVLPIGRVFRHDSRRDAYGARVNPDS